MARIALGIEYDGGAYSGWQLQSHAPSVQGALQTALGSVAAHPVELTAAGRTDAGVHALMQVAHFDSGVSRPDHAWALGGTAAAPDDLTVLWAREVPDHFHARHSALSRTYAYRIVNRSLRPALDRDRVCWVRRPLDAAAMQRAAQRLLGEHDFSAFRAAECQSSTAMRRLLEATVHRSDDTVRITVRANAFLHHMVRNLIGTLAAVGRGELSPQDVAAILASRDRALAGVTAPPAGLKLVEVLYPAHYGLPRCSDEA
jgi:tRNA pseudouridine38-40 synthase